MTQKNFLEKLFLSLISLSFVVGIWNSLPMTGAIFDEMFVGGVLRSIENHSIMPQGVDIPYGTLTYYVSYPLVVISLVLGWLFTGFDVSAVKVFFAENVYILYLVPRIISIFCGITLLYVLNGFLKDLNKDIKTRLLLLTLLFTNILVTVIFHTSKVWVLSTFLIVLSFIYLYKMLSSKEEVKKYMFLTLLFSFLAFANFPLAGFSLINVPIIFYYFRKDSVIMSSLVKFLVLGTMIFLVIFLSNFQGIISQIRSIIFDYTISEGAKMINVSFTHSLVLNFEKILKCYPIFLGLLLYIGFARKKIVNSNLFTISFVYLLFYFVVVSLVARWSVSPDSFLRYMFPIGFLLFFIVSSFDFKFNWKYGILGAISVLYWVFILYYLSVPTTYVEALNWINTNLNQKDVLIVHHASQEFDLPKNKDSYLITEEKYCGSKCKYVLEDKINQDVNYTFINNQTKDEYVDLSRYEDDKYWIANKINNDSDKVFVQSFINNKEDEEIFYIDYLGSYFERGFFSIGRLGKNIYIYKII